MRPCYRKPTRVSRNIERTCHGSYNVRITRLDERLSKTFRTLADAIAWRDRVAKLAPPTPRAEYRKSHD